jgi:hypothetical protein
MDDDQLEVLRVQVRALLVADKVTEDKSLKSEILFIRSHASIIKDGPGKFFCEANFGRGVAEQKEVTLFDSVTGKPIRWQPYESHLFAVHSSLCRAVLGISIG